MPRLQIRQKKGSSSIIEWALDQGLEEDQSQWQELLRAVATAILTAGAKTITHMATYVERFEALVRFLLLKSPPLVTPLDRPSAVGCRGPQLVHLVL